MKKSLLLGASAAAMLIATPALAQVELKISGGIDFQAGYASEDYYGEDGDNIGVDDFDFQTTSDMTFTGQGVADNGLTYGTRIALADILDGEDVAVSEVSMFFSGGWGELVLGDDDGAADNFETDPPTAGTGHVDGSFGDYIITSLNTSFGTTNSGDATKIYYASPSFSGFRVGVSYAPENDSGDTVSMDSEFCDDANTNADTTATETKLDDEELEKWWEGDPDFDSDKLFTTDNPNCGSDDWENAFEAGLLYEGDFNGFGLKASGTILTADGEGDEPDPLAYQIGVSGDTGPFGAGVQYWNNEDSNDKGNDQWGFNATATYTINAWKFGLGYAYAETEGDDSDTEDQVIGFGTTYTVAPGLSINGDLVYFDQDTGSKDNSGFVALTSVSASF